MADGSTVPFGPPPSGSPPAAQSAGTNTTKRTECPLGVKSTPKRHACGTAGLPPRADLYAARLKGANSGHAQPAVQCARALMQLFELGIDAATKPPSLAISIVLTGRAAKRRDLGLRRVSAASVDGLVRHTLAGFQQRLEIAEDPRPAAAALGRIATARHHAGDDCNRDVMGDGDRAHALPLLDLVGEA